jgi:hypothetical protein
MLKLTMSATEIITIWQNPCWKAKSCSSRQEIPNILWNQKVHLLYLQNHTTGPYRELDEFNLHLSLFI